MTGAQPETNPRGALGGRHDLFSLPPLHVCCGTDDPLLPSNRRYVAACERAGVAVDTDFGPGDHDWA